MTLGVDPGIVQDAAMPLQWPENLSWQGNHLHQI